MRIKHYLLIDHKSQNSIKSVSVLVFFICCFSQTFAFRGNRTGFYEANLSVNKFQQKIVTGKVISPEDNLGIPGVNVVIKGTTKSAVTDLDGNFSIETESDDTILVFTSIGFKTQEIRVGSQTEINVTMQTEAETLGEVVIVGYGTQKKVTSTGSIETVAAKTFQDRAVTNPVLALQGQTPGLTVTRSSSRPGKENLALQIRGATSVNGGSPLVVIDGVPAITAEAFYNMNSDDIQSVTVLKDASAAIYGSRAANGVILVTTKKGAIGKMKVDFSSSLRVNTLGIKPPSPTMQQYATVWLEAAAQDGAQANYWGWQSQANLLAMQSGHEGIYPTQYWGNVYIGNAPRYDEMFGTSYSNMQNASLSGATDKTNFRMSYSYAEDIGALKTAYDGKQQHNVRVNYDYKVTDWLKLETGISYLKYDISGPSTGLDGNSVASDPPFFPSRNPYGQWYANFNIAGNRNAIAATSEGGRENTKVDQMKLNIAATLNFTKDLSFRITSSYNKDFNNYQSYEINVPQYSWFGVLSPESVNTNPSIREQSRYIIYQTYGGFLNYNKSIGDHNLTGMVGLTAEKSQDKTLYGYRKGFQDFGVYDINLGSRDQLVEATGGAGQYGLYSYVGRITYDFKNKYLLEFNGRRDGSSKFAEGYKWSNFGSVQAGWVITQEKFMEALKPVSLLKLRGTYGVMGNQVGINNYDYVSSISTGTAVFGTAAANQNTSFVTAIISNDRTWERVSTASVGADFGFFDGKLFGSYDYYTKTNDNMLVNVTYPDVLGGVAPKTNDGTLKTKGWEVMLGYKGEVGKFKYSVSANMGDSRNKLVAMEGANTFQAGLVNARVGFPLNSYFMYQTDGLFQTQQQVDAYYAANTGTSQGVLPSTALTQVLRVGDVIRRDLDGNGYISDVGNGTTDKGDVKYMGDAAPHYVYGITLNGQYGKFDVTGFFQGVLEQNIQRTDYLAYPFATIYTNQTAAYIGKTWTPENTGAAYPRMTSDVTRSAWNWRNNDFALQNNRYIRLKTLIVGYTLTDLEIADLKLDKFRVYFSGNDLWELTKVKDGYDPEFGPSSNSTYPFTRTWSLGVNVSF